MKLELSPDREIDLMLKYQLTADEVFVLRLIFYAQEGHAEYLNKFFVENNGQLTCTFREILVSLQSKSIINKTYKVPETGKPFKPLDVDFNKNAIRSFLQHSQDLGMELFEKYPSFTTIQGRTFSLRNITKLYKSLDEMCFAYGKEIKFDELLHMEVIDLLEWGKENNLIRSGICDFIASRQWETLRELRDGGTVVFDAMEGI